MPVMTTAERRGLQQICGSNGTILAIACDQRGGIRQLLASDPAEQKKISDAVLGDTKTDVVTELARHAPCVLLDAVCAVPRVIEEGTLPRDVALLIGLDASGQDLDPNGHYLSRLSPGITARKVRELGGTGAKLMVYLRSDHKAAMRHNLDIIRRCVADFAAEDLLLVVEFLLYKLPGETSDDLKAKSPALIEGGSEMCLELGVQGVEDSLSRFTRGLRGHHETFRQGSVGGAVGRCRPFGVQGAGRNFHGQWGLGRDRGARAVEGLRVARPGEATRAACRKSGAALARAAGDLGALSPAARSAGLRHGPAHGDRH